MDKEYANCEITIAMVTIKRQPGCICNNLYAVNRYLKNIIQKLLIKNAITEELKNQTFLFSSGALSFIINK